MVRKNDPEYQREYYKKNKHYKLAVNTEWDRKHPRSGSKRSCYHRMSCYEMSDDEYRKMLTEQNGQCKICGMLFYKTPHVDHDHSSGKVRGLLCGSCNSGLGFFKDRADLLTRAITYLMDGKINV